MTAEAQEPWIVHGVDLSYFTGKLEANLRAKGVRYERRNMSSASWRALAGRTGVQHMPIVERADGSLMSDTTQIHRWLEAHHPGPALSPSAPDVRFIARLVEDWADESLWRPAMHWRWKQLESAAMQSWRIASQFLADSRVPARLLAIPLMIRQYGFFVWRDGVRTRAQRRACDGIYLELLAVLEPLFARRPYLLGKRPTEADFGLFGPFFRHFFGDPLPGPVMQERAPQLMHWVTRMWATTPERFAREPLIDTLPDDLGPLLGIIVRDHIPYLRANAEAVAAGAKRTRYAMHGVQWSEFSKPYRLWCLAELQREFTALADGEKTRVRKMLGDAAVDQLMAPLPATPTAPPKLPIPGDRRVPARDSWMRW